MLRKKTAFVLGAGASCEAGLPSGEALKKQIAEMLDDSFEEPGDSSLPGATVLEGLDQYAREKGHDPSDVRFAAYDIRNSMPLALSIDNFLDARRGDADVETCGKLAIAQAILDGERHSKMYPGDEPGMTPDLALLEGTWYPKLFQLLTEGVDGRNCRQIFDNAIFVIFNYDRCVEYFLSNALDRYYRIEREDLCSTIREAAFVHPYGTVGSLLWDGDDVMPFGRRPSIRTLRESARRLRTFTEQVQDQSLVENLSRSLKDVETIIFLGFAFHQQNMEFLRGLKNCKRAFATAYGISGSDCGVVRGQILSLQSNNFHIEIRNDLTCVGLFEQYWRTFRME